MKTKLRIYVVILLICFFNISCFSVFPESHAKYIKEEVDKLTYDATLYKLTGNYKTIGINRNRSTSTTGYFYILFDRNTLMYDNDTTDNYTITVGSNNTSTSSICKIDSIISSGTNSKVSDYIYDVTYDHNDSNTITINVICDMDEEYYFSNPSDYINVSLSVSENIDGEKTFTYINTSYVLTTYQEYYEVYGSLYNKALYFIRNTYADDSSLREVAMSYFNSVFLTDSDIETKTLDGFNYDSSTGTFSLSSDFLKYARTYYSTTNGNGKYYFYFDSSSTDSSALNSLFEYYLSKYTNFNESDYNELITYVNTKPNGILDVLTSGLTGFSVVDDTAYNHKILSFKDSIINIANYVNNPTPVSVIAINNDKVFNMKAYLRNYINNYEGLSDTVKSGLINNIISDANYQLSLLVTANATNNGTQSTNDSFSELFFDTFGEAGQEEKIMANVYADGVEAITYVKFYNLEEGNTVIYTSPTEITETDYNSFVDEVHEDVYGEPLDTDLPLPDATLENGFYTYDYVIEE